MKRAMGIAAALAMLAGCAIQPPAAPPATRTPPPAATPQTPPSTATKAPPTAPAQVPPTTTAPSPGAQIGTTASGGTIRVNDTSYAAAATVPAVVDSTPSTEALAVLNSIPEPLAQPGTTPAAPESVSARPGGVSPTVGAAPTDDAGHTPTDSAAAVPADTAEVPVPSPTEPLGDRPGSLASKALPESLAAPSPAPNSPPAAGSGSGTTATSGAAAGSASAARPGAAPAAPPGAVPAPPDSCWRVQVAAPPERERADRLAAAARSQLTSTFVVEKESGLYKVRTRDCLTAVAADDLRRRAVATGFEGAFRFLRKRK